MGGGWIGSVWEPYWANWLSMPYFSVSGFIWERSHPNSLSMVWLYPSNASIGVPGSVSMAWVLPSVGYRLSAIPEELHAGLVAFPSGIEGFLELRLDLRRLAQEASEQV